MSFFRPNSEEHGFWFDIQPVTGTTLSARARIQINVNIRYIMPECQSQDSDQCQHQVSVPYHTHQCGIFIPDPDFYPSRIPNPGSKISNKREGEKICCHTLFYSYKFHKIENYLFLKC
jgi:hypothetical protein